MLRTTRFPDGFGDFTNRYMSDRMKTHQSWEEVPTGQIRAGNVERWRNSQGGIGMRDLQTLMVNPETGVCADPGGQEAEPESTLRSWTAPPGPFGIELYRGMPGETWYDPVVFEDKA